MDRNEFNQWLATHQKAYPALGDWFAQLPDQKGTLTIWHDTLLNVDKKDADEATMRMIRGEEPIVKFINWHDTPRFILEHSRSMKRDRAPSQYCSTVDMDRRDSFACLECHDTGIIEVFHSIDVKAIRRQKFRGNCVHRSCRACSCTAAARYSAMIKKGDMQVFGAEYDVALPRNRSSCTQATRDADIQLCLAAMNREPQTLEQWADSQ